MVLIHHQAREHGDGSRDEACQETDVAQNENDHWWMQFCQPNDMFQKAVWLRQPEPAFTASNPKQSIIPTLGANEALHICFSITSALSSIRI